MDNKLVCDGCGSTDEVVKSTAWWTAWGRNCFDFNWSKHTGEKKLCSECEERDWEICCVCGDLIEEEYLGIGYLPEDYEGAPICPKCAEEKGFEITVNIET